MNSSERVMTVLGPIAPEQMGVTLSHDHLLVDGWGIRELYDAILDDEELAVREAARYKAAGGGTICDPTNIGLARAPAALKRISERSGVHVVMGAGWYRERVYPDYVLEEMPDQLADRLVTELVDGVDGTGVKPGFIGEIGTERHHVTPAQERVFRAAGRAHRRTGVPIMTHTTHWGELAIEQLDLLAEEGVPAAAVIISHLGDRPGIRHWLPIAERGAWLDVDNLAFIGGYAPLSVRADNVAGLCAEGLAGQVMLSNDICELGQLAFYDGCGYDNVIVNFLPMLRERGVSEEDIHTMTVANPGKAFAWDLSRVGA
ncbi:phosphotriesterase family protein [Conexibacter woesei]|uniref:Aryldialkylphosphatase n=1 Tax=Conexibacter woesei (strain DSM 14684 / CCUG 47730 / CIP 108061 / JCM 11494 / NBRC 100937 / ID131577) TaxID=469383 RepID=D3F532_CONWI|nr:aryldialkylphosphatase [Conexibacter woesei]ADB48610.1 aryldialkylphosphatase [Conexibacter woesei DSM 14684]